MSGERCPHHLEKLLPGDHAGDLAAKLAGARQTLGVGAGELPHQQRAPLHPETVADEIVMVEDEFPLLVECGVGHGRIAAEDRGGLGEDPRLREGFAGDHHAVAAALAKPPDSRRSRVDIAVAHDRHPRHAPLHRGDRVPVGLPLEKLRRHAAVHGQARGARLLDPLRDLHGRAAGVGAAEPDLGGHRHAVTRFDHAADDHAHAVWIAKQPRPAVGLLGDLSHRAAEVEIDHAHLEILGQPAADLGQVVGIVVPHLHRQRPRLVANTP